MEWTFIGMPAGPSSKPPSTGSQQPTIIYDKVNAYYALFIQGLKWDNGLCL